MPRLMRPKGESFVLHQITIIVETNALTKLKRKPPKRVESAKMGRPRRSNALRVSRGVRLDPELVGRADTVVDSVVKLRRSLQKAGEPPLAGELWIVSNFTDIVELALKEWLERNEARVKKAA